MSDRDFSKGFSKLYEKMFESISGDGDMYENLATLQAKKARAYYLSLIDNGFSKDQAFELTKSEY